MEAFWLLSPTLLCSIRGSGPGSISKSRWKFDIWTLQHCHFEQVSISNARFEWECMPSAKLVICETKTAKAQLPYGSVFLSLTNMLPYENNNKLSCFAPTVAETGVASFTVTRKSQILYWYLIWQAIQIHIRTFCSFDFVIMSEQITALTMAKYIELQEIIFKIATFNSAPQQNV